MSVGVRALCPRLVGRERELSALEDSLLAARRGAGGVVILGGEAGMGKTRLAEELVRGAERLGFAVMTGSCTEAEVALPYLPFLEALGNHLARADAEAVAARLGPAAEELGQLFPMIAREPLRGDPTHSKLRLFEAIVELLADAAGDRGLLLVLEDLHWADPATRELLDYLTRRLRSTRVLTLATFRTEELHRKHPLLPIIQGWRRAGVEVVEVAALDVASVSEVLCAIFDEPSVSDEFSQFVLDRTEGNPFVVEEMLKEALDRGDIYRTEDGWDRKALRELRVPPTVRDGILLRVGRLSDDDARVLGAASVVDRAFDAGLIAAATGLSSDDVIDGLQRCVVNQLLVEVPADPGSYRFRHALTREAVYEDMVTPRRQQLHGRMADLLAERGRPAAELAHHLLLARRDSEAVAMCRTAAREAMDASAWADAAALLERAVPLVHEAVERARILAEAAAAEWECSRSTAAAHLLEEALPALEAAGLAAEAAGHRVLLGRCYWESQRSDLARAQFERALAVLEPMGPSSALATVLIRLSGQDLFEMRFQAALELAERAEAVAAAAGDDRSLAWAWIFQASPLGALGRLEDGFVLTQRGLRLAWDGGHWFQAGNAIYNETWSCVHLGLGARARSLAATSLPEAKIAFGVTDYLRAYCDVYSGELETAAGRARAAVEHFGLADNEKNRWRANVLLAHALAELGRGDEAAAAMPPLSTRVDPQDAVYDTTARIRVALALGDAEAARRLATATDPGICHRGGPADAVAHLMLDEPEALTAFVAALPVQGETIRTPRVQAAQGMAMLARGEREAAAQRLAEVRGRFEAEGFLLDAWYTGLPLARALPAPEAEALLRATVAEAAGHDARLVCRLALATAADLGLEVPMPKTAAADSVVAADGGPAATGERLVSVLFADIRGYTAASAETAPAENSALVAAFHRWATSAVRAHHGVVDKFAGDAVMATFNVAGTSVDHAEHAVASALQIVEKAAAAGLPVGAGVATGPAIVGRLTEGGNLSVLGPTTNLAARLQATSPAGTVTVSDETRRRLAASMTSEPVDLELKGFAGPVRAHRLRAT